MSRLQGNLADVHRRAQAAQAVNLRVGVGVSIGLAVDGVAAVAVADDDCTLVSIYLLHRGEASLRSGRGGVPKTTNRSSCHRVRR